LIYPVDGGVCFGPKPGRVISKLGYYINPPVNVSAASLVRGTALGLIHTCNHIPPLQIYLTKLLDLTKGVKAFVPTQREDWKLKYHAQQSVVETNVTLSNRYQWTEALQKEFVSEVSEMVLGKDCIRPIFSLLCDRDTSGPNSVWIAPVAA